jgi:branched-chain amino acid transport system permease protein
VDDYLAWLPAPWPPGLGEWVASVFLNAILSGITLVRLASSHPVTLVFGPIQRQPRPAGRTLGGYLVSAWSRRRLRLLRFRSSILAGALGLLLQHQVFRRMEREELRQTLVTIGISIVLADLMLWFWGGQSYQVLSPDWLSGPMTLPLVSSIRSNGEAVYRPIRRYGSRS